MKPNLFQFATSELSQDAALCWLLAWADVAHRNENPELHELGGRLLEAFFRKTREKLPRPAEVKLHRQLFGVDIAAEIGDRHVLLLEDKVHSSDHSDQLARYLKAAARHFPERKAIPIYLKTGEQGSFEAARRAGWQVFSRKDLLAVLHSASASSDILHDFRVHLESIDAAVEAFRSVPPASWSRRAWEGFFQVIKTKIADGEWNYVPNKNGGFMGFWWGWHSVRGGSLYLQLEEDDLVAKVEANSRELDARSELRDRWSTRVIGAASPVSFKRPDRFGNGAYMTVATSAAPYLKLSTDGLLDLVATVAVLRQATVGLDAIAQTARDEAAS